jgi:hypothetical protein
MGYKPYSDSYLMSLTKAEIIELLRVAEHNFLATEEVLNNSVKTGMEMVEKFNKAKELLKSAINVLKIYRPCDDDICSECINHTRRSYATDYLRRYEDDYFEWKYLNTPELKKIIGE